MDSNAGEKPLKGRPWEGSGKKNKERQDRYSPFKEHNPGILQHLTKSPREIITTEKVGKTFTKPPKMISNARDTSKYSVMPTQEYMQIVVEDVDEDADFNIVAIVKSCSLNMLGDLKVTLKDLSGTIPETIHYKVLDVGSYGNDITVGAAMILANVSVFTPKPSQHYLNITMRNVIEVFRKDTVFESGSG
nr:hypothetical protein [Tanacetum cinerariifolium]